MRSFKLISAMGAGLGLLMVAGCASAPTPPNVASTTSVGSTTPNAAAKPAKVVLNIPEAPPVPGYSKTVMDNGMVITASTPAGKISVGAGPGLLRTVSWDGTKRYVVMKPRQQPHFGSQGIYFDGHPDGWQNYKGLSSIRYEEGQRQFENIDDASIWMQIRRLHYVYSNNGLVVGWTRKPSEGTLQVEVWQFFIDGEKPNIMPGAMDYLIQTRQAPVRADNS